MLTVFGLSFRSGDWNLYRLLLTGVVFSAGCGALISLILLLAPQAAVKGMLFWLLGDLSGAASPGWAWVVLGALGAASISLRRRPERPEPRAQQGSLAGVAGGSGGNRHLRGRLRRNRDFGLARAGRSASSD